MAYNLLLLTLALFSPIAAQNFTNTTTTMTPTNTTNTTDAASTSTIYATDLITITACAATITNCPLRNHSTSNITTSSPVSQILFAAQEISGTAADMITTTLVAYTTVPCSQAAVSAGVSGQNNAGGAGNSATGTGSSAAPTLPSMGNVSMPAGGGMPTPSPSSSGKDAGVVASAGERGVRLEVVWGLTVFGLAVLSFCC